MKGNDWIPKKFQLFPGEAEGSSSVCKAVHWKRLAQVLLHVGQVPTHQNILPYAHAAPFVHDATMISYTNSQGPLLFLLDSPDISLLPKQKKAIHSLLKTLQSILAYTCDVTAAGPDDNADGRTRRTLEKRVWETISLLETVLPIGLVHTPLVHMLVHIPSSVYKWNNVRNFWQFFGERYVEYVLALRTSQ